MAAINGMINDMVDEDAWYHAYQSRDRRFDGVFFMGVTSTYIYCRPICPSRTPKRENVRFFLTATAAEREGFRACKRCKPERAPGHHNDGVIPDQVRKALHLIENGFLDHDTVERLANVVGLTSRHLRRMFAEHMGITPASLAQTKRLQIAKQLIERSSLPLSQIAFQAGFQSVRSFNARIKEAFSVTPTDLRRGARGTPGMWTEIRLRISYRPPYPWRRVQEILRAELLPGIESLDETTYKKLIMLDGELAAVELHHDAAGNCFELAIQYRSPPSCTIRSFVVQARVFLDAAADPLRLSHCFVGTDLARRFEQGVRLIGALDPLQMAVRLILQQTMSPDAATRVLLHLCEDVGDGVSPLPELKRVFPDPHRVQHAVGRVPVIAPAKAAIGTLCRQLSAGRIDLYPVAEPSALREQLRLIAGIDPTTADAIAMRATGYPDLPCSDGRFESFRPWRSYARFAAECGGS
ncbi:MAG: helix-turn-helix domain-containing protein [Proteobacteria bacterium]|nr:helix-turn-helix domain-containing protein [Pseudomonadota bacterium]